MQEPQVKSMADLMDRLNQSSCKVMGRREEVNDDLKMFKRHFKHKGYKDWHRIIRDYNYTHGTGYAKRIIELVSFSLLTSLDLTTMSLWLH